ncbi:LacI family transcriptional regulator [Motilibacter rhizosphaerae]|uniref:LacI family transcriptional regulator n=1 Tax=Motilibacter rhizosphaerae TaxID=598652 RepID=A0A4Q7NW71_9ACTN|nr:LacI family DNA-binding transcriptional regulator [Motilibacter rhizosphaerae]RZS91543.1 LacI family transcriptional regulator [Motilibacter rhizosphaerae]
MPPVRRLDGGGATLRDVAALAGVSPRTVSNVVGGYAAVTPATRAKVEAAIAELGYRPNVLARNLAYGRTGQIAVVVPYLDTPYFAELLQAIIPRARARGYDVLIDQTDGDADHERALLARAAGSFRYDGLILSPLGLVQEDLAERDPTLPLVVLGERRAEPGFDHIGIDDVAAARDATAHLLGLGRRRVAAIGEQRDREGVAARLRTQGYRQAHAEAGVEVDESLVVPRPRFNRRDGYEGMVQLLERDDPPDAVFGYSDLVAQGAVRAILERGLRVPEDIAVIGYDDIDEGRYSTPTLSTISQDRGSLGTLAVDRILARVESGAQVPGQELLVEHRLVARESTLGR